MEEHVLSKEGMGGCMQGDEKRRQSMRPPRAKVDRGEGKIMNGRLAAAAVGSERGRVERGRRLEWDGNGKIAEGEMK